MAAWIIPALKTIVPHIGTIISAAVPVFTSKRTDQKSDEALLIHQQISELQTAAARNAENTKELAAQLQGTVKALEQASVVAESKINKAFAFSLLATALSIVAVCFALVAVFTR